MHVKGAKIYISDGNQFSFLMASSFPGKNCKRCS